MRRNDLSFAPTRFVRGHQFIQRGNQFIDTAVERMPNARHIRVQFDSREYFELLIRYPKALPCLSAARNVQLALDNTVHEIYE